MLLINKYKSNNYFFLNFPQKSKYNWSINNTIFNKFLSIDFTNSVNINNFMIINKSISSKLNNIVSFKKKSSLIKKNTDYEYNILIYSNNTKDSYYLNSSEHILNKFNKPKQPPFRKKKKNKPRNYKTLDFTRKFSVIIQQNRKLLKKFLKIKFKRQFSLSRYIRKLIKMNNLDFLINFEYRLVNLLTRCSFFFNYNDCIWFLKNGYVSVNGLIEYNEKKIIKPMDIVNLPLDNYYFFYYRFMLNSCIGNLYKFNNKIWRVNKQRFNDKPKNEERYPNWIYKYVYYKEDIPKFLEVDYMSMTMVILNYSFNSKHIEFYNIKFLNLYLNRLYNWKSII